MSADGINVGVVDKEWMGKLGKGIALTAVVAATGALMLGGYTFLHDAGHGVEAASYSATAAPTPTPEQDTTSALAFHDGEVAQMRAADLAAQAAAKAAADQAAADAAAAAAPKTVKRATVAPPASGIYHGPQIWTGAKHASGTILPTTTNNDPNAGDYGAQVFLWDPASYCASQSGTGMIPGAHCT